MAKILIVDDAKFMRITLSNIIQALGHEVIAEAENGLEAIEKFKELKPDIITMDITMPVLSGLEALKEIKAFDKNAKVIMCSAMGQHKMMVDAIEAGAKDFITKPFEHARVREAINRLL